MKLQETFAHLVPLATVVGALVILSPTSQAQHWFDAPLRVNVLPAGFFVDHADFDGDGDEDLLGQFLGDLTWARNDGHATFTLGPSLDLPTQNVYTPKVFADFDQDGRLDLAVVVGDLQNPAGLSIYLGTHGGYLAPLFVAPGVNIAHLELGQIDQDPEPEIAFFGTQAFPTYAVGWIDFTGGVPVVVSTATSDYNFGANSHATLDVDGDGIADQLMASENRIDVFPTGPGGSLSYSETLITGHPAFDYMEMVVGDLDQDGDRDLVTWVNIGSSQTRVIALEKTPGGLIEHPATTVSGNVSARGFLGDWDQDGDLDLLAQDLVAIGGIRWHQLRNEGGFNFPINLGPPVQFTGFGAGLADFDNDGFLDYAGPAELFFGDGNFGTLFPGEVSVGPTIQPEAPATDWEGDGDQDLLLGASILTNNGRGQLTTQLVFPPTPTGEFYQGITATADFNSDGRLDHLARYLVPGPQFPFVQYDNTHLLVDDGLGKFTDLGPVLPQGVDLGTGVVNGLTPFDVDGDGDLDLVVNGLVWTQGTTGNFTGPTTFTAIDLPTLNLPSYQRVDLDDDGAVELLLRGGSPSSLWRIDHLPSLALQATLLYSGSGVGLPALYQDADGDGHKDLLVEELNGSFSRVVILPGTASGFAAPVQLPFQPVLQARFGLDDVDGDGRLDLLAAATSFSPYVPLFVYRGLPGAFQYEPPRSFVTRGMWGFADLDEDGDLDGYGLNLIGSRRFQGPDDGQILQYGQGTPGTGDGVPLLGASGPVRTGSTSAALHLRRALGGSPTLFAIGTASASLPDLPFPGMEILVDPGTLLGLLEVPLGGVGPGAGQLDIHVNVSPLVAGKTFTHQFFLLDPASPVFFTQTNGLEIHYGL